MRKQLKTFKKNIPLDRLRKIIFGNFKKEGKERDEAIKKTLEHYFAT